MTNINALEEKLKNEDELLPTKNEFTNASLKQIISKFTFFSTTIPPLVIITISFILQWKSIYALLIIFMYMCILFWIIESKFEFILRISEKAQKFISNALKNVFLGVK